MIGFSWEKAFASASNLLLLDAKPAGHQCTPRSVKCRDAQTRIGEYVEGGSSGLTAIRARFSADSMLHIHIARKCSGALGLLLPRSLYLRLNATIS